MKSRLLVFAATVAIAIALGSRLSAQPPDVQLIVDQFYPVERLEPDDPAAKRSCHYIWESDAESVPLAIVAAYTDQWTAVVRILQRAGGSGYQVAVESPQTPRLMGSVCEVKKVDVNGDGQPEIFLELIAGRGSVAWVFKWDGTSLMNWTPTLAGSTALRFPKLIDIYHDDTIQIVSTGQSSPPPEGERLEKADTLYHLSPNGFVADRRVLLATEFWPGTTALGRLQTFALAEASVGPYMLRITNGDRFGQRRATGGTVSINGTTVVSQLSQQVEFLEVPLQLELGDENSLEVLVQGPTDAIVVAVVEDLSLPAP